MIKNPLEQPVPDDMRLRVRDFARDFAWGVVKDYWSLHLPSTRNNMGRVMLHREHERLRPKWKRCIPDYRLLIVYGYAEFDDDYLLTRAAFGLLDQARPASIFISYNRSESSAFALLLVERMRAVGLDPFLDIKDLNPGGQWHAELQEGIQERENFVCLVGPETLKSEYVRQEIRWAQEGDGIRILPVYHNDFDADQNTPTDLPSDEQISLDAFLNLQATIVPQENPKAYRSAIDELLNAFGYVP